MAKALPKRRAWGRNESLGLIGMRERAQLIGGSMTITGVTGKGTVLTGPRSHSRPGFGLRKSHAKNSHR